MAHIGGGDGGDLKAHFSASVQYLLEQGGRRMRGWLLKKRDREGGDESAAYRLEEGGGLEKSVFIFCYEA